MNLSLLAVFLCAYVQTVTSLYCYWNTGCPYNYFSSKTPYNAVRGDIRDSVVKLTGCEPISIWGLVRHGKRNPGLETAVAMKNAVVIKDNVITSYERGNSSLCAQDIEDLKNVVVDKQMFENVHQLSDEGFEEMVGIGKRIKQAFPKLLENLETGSYTIRPAFGNWMEKCATGFVKGLQNRNVVVEKGITEYDIMDPYTTCGKYQREVKKNPDILAEAIKYQESSEFLASKDRIQRRLGLDYPLTSENMTGLYNMCPYTWSTKLKMSPWCALFTTEDLKVMEYYTDLRHYYRNGYGTPFSQKLGQIPLVNLLNTFKEVVEGGQQKKLTTYFTHAAMMDMVYTSLDLFKDDAPLTSAHRNPDRKWRTSKSSIFGANLFAVLNKCSKDGGTDHNVVFYLNEEPLIPICKEGVCTWEEFVNKLSSMSDDSNDICEFRSLPYVR